MQLQEDTTATTNTVIHVLLSTQNQKIIMAVFLTDAQSVLQPLTNNKWPHLAKTLQLLSNNWSGYSPIAEFLEINKQTCSQRKMHRQNNQVLMWATKKLPYLPKRLWCQVKRMMPTIFRRSEQVIMMSLRTVHTQLNVHMHNKLKMVPWSAYLCCNEYQTKEYIHQKCKRHDKETFSVHVTALYMPVIKKTVHQWIRTLLFHSLAAFKEFQEM